MRRTLDATRRLLVRAAMTGPRARESHWVVVRTTTHMNLTIIQECATPTDLEPDIALFGEHARFNRLRGRRRRSRTSNR